MNTDFSSKTVSKTSFLPNKSDYAQGAESVGGNRESVRIFPLALTLLFLTCALAFPDTVRTSVINSLNLCAKTLIPSLFLFMVAGEVFFALGGHRPLARLLGRPFEAVFGISSAGSGAFLLGAVCGLPLGAKYALTLYKSGEITKEECEILMGISNNAGLGFVVMGIGYTVWGSTAFGWLLYGCEIFGAIVSGILLSPRKNGAQKADSIAPVTKENQKMSFFAVLAEAVSSSAVNMLRLCGFVVIFGAFSAFLKQLCTAVNLPPLFFTTLSAFTEITFGCTQARELFVSGAPLAVYSAKIITFFAVGFSGMSAHMQSAAFALRDGIKMKKYYALKLLSGLICAFTGALILRFLHL